MHYNKDFFVFSTKNFVPNETPIEQLYNVIDNIADDLHFKAFTLKKSFFSAILTFCLTLKYVILLNKI